MSRTVKFIALTFSEGLNVLIGFLFLPYLARAMKIIDYGTYGQTLLVGDICKGLFAFGLAKVIFSFLANDQYDQKKVLSSNVFSAIIMGAVCSLVIISLSPLIVSNFDNPALSSLIWIYAIAIPFQLAYSSLNASLIFFDKAKSSASIAVLTNLLRVILIVIAVQVYYSLELIFLSLIIVAIVQIVLCVWRLPADLKDSKGIDKALIKRQLASGWPLGIASIIGVLFWAIDGVMVSSMMDVKSYAVYKNGAFQIPFISSIYAALTAIILPDVSKYFFKNDFAGIVSLKKRIISNASTLIIPTVVFCIFFAPTLIVLYLSERYAASASVFMIYNLILLARFTSYDDLFIATNNNKQMPLIYICCLTLNIILNYFLIKAYGINGAAISSVISFYVLIIWLFTKGSSFINAKPGDFLEVGKIFKVLFISIVLSLLFYLSQRVIKYNAFTVLVIMALYLAIIYHLMLKMKLLDKKILISLLEKIPPLKMLEKAIQRIY